jgi:hypothetical protein
MTRSLRSKPGADGERLARKLAEQAAALGAEPPRNHFDLSQARAAVDLMRRALRKMGVQFVVEMRDRINKNLA